MNNKKSVILRILALIIILISMLSFFRVSAKGEQRVYASLESSNNSSLILKLSWNNMIRSYYLPVFNNYIVEDSGTDELLTTDKGILVEFPAPYNITISPPELPIEEYNKSTKKMIFDKSHVFPVYRVKVYFLQNYNEICNKILNGEDTFLNNIETLYNGSVLELKDTGHKMNAQVRLEENNYKIFMNNAYYKADNSGKYYLENILSNEYIQKELISSELNLNDTRAYALLDIAIGDMGTILFSDGKKEYILFLDQYPYSTVGTFYYEKFMTKSEKKYLRKFRFKKNELYDINTCIEFIKNMRYILDESAQRARDAGEI